MKKKRNTPAPRYTPKRGDIKKDLSPEQLAGIGAAALAYNVTERQIDDLFWAVTKLHKSPLAIEVSSRRLSVEAKIEVIKIGATQFGLSSAETVALADTLGKGVFQKFKGYRNAMVHSSILNTAAAIGITFTKKAEAFDVLLTTAALDAFYNQLVALRDELSEFHKLFMLARKLVKCASDDPRRASREAAKIACWAQVRDLRRKRLSLPQVPECPPESEWNKLGSQVQQAQIEVLLGSLQLTTSAPRVRVSDRGTMGVQASPTPLLEGALRAKEKKKD